MKRKGKRTKGMEEARPFEGMSKVNKNAAGVDIGATEIVACVSGGDDIQLVKTFGNYTVDLLAICEWFRQHDVKTVAMESTGVYWKPVYNILEGCFTTWVVNARHPLCQNGCNNSAPKFRVELWGGAKESEVCQHPMANNRTPRYDRERHVAGSR